MTGLLLLAPGTPLLFQGQEWNSTAPFLFFADHNAELRPLVRKGRAKFLAQFPSCTTPERQDRMPDPGEPETPAACRLDWSEPGRTGHQESLALHRDLIALRRADPVIAAQGDHGVQIDGAVITGECLAVRFSGPSEERLLILNLGRDLHLRPMAEPLLAPPAGKRWVVQWSSESVRYGGTGAPMVVDQGEGWRFPGQAAVLLQGVSVT